VKDNKVLLEHLKSEGITLYQALDNIFELADDGASPSEIKEYCSKLMNIPYGMVSHKELVRESWEKLNNRLTHKHRPIIQKIDGGER
jgi:hypothetical protein